MNAFLRDQSRIDRYIVFSKNVAGRDAILEDFPPQMLPEIKEYLQQKGILQLYQHQSEMFSQALAGNNIVITTSTASGKTLSFLLPVLQQILQNPQSRAIFIYPTKALASDQYRALKPFLDYFGKGKIDAGVYDGDTPVNERSRIRSSSNIILTNPEMLNAAFLPHHNQNGYNFIFSNLKFIVIDELHTYRGAFGSHLSNLFKRLSRICNYYHSAPQFFCSSATIANPLELAETICGKKFVLIDKDGSPAPEKSYKLIQPPFIDAKNDIRRSVASVAADIVPELTVQKHSFITFCKSRKVVEVVLKESRDHLKSDDISGADYSNLISGYRGGYRPEERKEIEQKMVNGQLRGLVSTNALELGIDIGKIDTTVIAGYPGTRASFWQQSGRAGRSGGASETFLILDNLPFDQFIAVDPEWLFQSKNESAVVDPSNLFIQLAHVRAAAAELPLSLDDIAVFPDLGEIIPVLARAQELRPINGRFMWSGKEFPAGDYNLRNMDNTRYQLINAADNSVITEMDEIQAFREIHQGAVYLHDGQAYLVSSLDIENKRAIATPVNDDYYTVPFSSTGISIIKEQKSAEVGRTICKFGDVRVTTGVGAYKKLQFHNHQNLGFETIDPPLTKSYDTEGAWIQLPEEVVELFAKLEPAKASNMQRNYWKTYFDGLGFALQNAAMMSTMTTSEDIAADRINNPEIDHASSFICIYDMFVGGLGYSEKAYDLIDTVIHNAIKMVEGCRCKDGCAACVGDHHLDKKVVLWGVKSIFEKVAPPVIAKEVYEPAVDIERKPFSFDELEDCWAEFVRFYHSRGEGLSNFITSVKSVRTHYATLQLHVENSFYASWIMEPANKARLENSISHYVEVPVQFEIQAESDDNPMLAKEGEILRRYQDLTQ